MKTGWLKVLVGFFVVAGALMFIMLKAPPNLARESFTDFQYITHSEHTSFDEIIWFWTYDSLWGRVHSNDFIGVKYSPHFFGHVSSSQPDLRYWQPGNVHFEEWPRLGAPIRYFPMQADSLRAYADPFIESDDGRLMTWIKLRGEDGIDVYQYRLGRTPHDDSLLTHLDPIDTGAIFVDGQLELEGELVGTLTIGCARNMWLVRDVHYEGANKYTGWFEEENMEHMLGLISERNIIIKDTWANGRENGFRRYGALDIEHHSIVINAALLALGESFTFEHQNDDWEPYQGPDPWDERGIIHLKGSVAQYRRGYIHRSNHWGTGYSKDYRYDFRLEDQAPPWFPEIARQDIPGDGNNLYLNGDNSPYRVLGEGGYQTINAGPGTHIILLDSLELACSDALRLEGTEEEPVVVTRENPDEYPIDAGLMCIQDTVITRVELRYAHLAENVKLVVDCDTAIFENCVLEGGVEFQGDSRWVELAQCRIAGPLTIPDVRRLKIEGGEFAGKVTIETDDSRGEVDINAAHFHSGLVVKGDGEHRLTGLVVEGGMMLDSREAEFRLQNNDFIKSDSAGLKVNAAEQIIAVNNIFALNDVGVLLTEEQQGGNLFTYNNCWGNDSADYIGVEPGEGSISADPLFVDSEGGDYHLQPESPCIDAGDPDSPRDPDGTRADIGAISFDYRHIFPSGEPTVISGLSLTAAPNPFNRQVELRLRTSITGMANVKIYDILGREIESLSIKVSPGSNRLVVNGSSFGVSGIYFVQVGFSGVQKTVKLVYMP